MRLSSEAVGTEASVISDVPVLVIVFMPCGSWLVDEKTGYRLKGISDIKKGQNHLP